MPSNARSSLGHVLVAGGYLAASKADPATPDFLILVGCVGLAIGVGAILMIRSGGASARLGRNALLALPLGAFFIVLGIIRLLG